MGRVVCIKCSGTGWIHKITYDKWGNKRNTPQICTACAGEGYTGTEADNNLKDNSTKEEIPDNAKNLVPGGFSRERDWNTLFAIIGFLAGFGYMVSLESEPNLIFSFASATVAGFISGRFYKVLIGI